MKFLETLRYSHTKVTRVDLYRDDQPVFPSLPLISATVDDDYTADVRRRCDVTLAGTDEILELLPEQPRADGGLWPVGNELRIRSGIRYNDGTEELVPMGVFRVAKPNVSATSGGDRIVKVQGYDRSRAVSRNKFIEPYNVSPIDLHDIPVAIKNLLQDRLPLLGDEHFVLMSSIWLPTPMTFTRENDPWKDSAVRMAEAIGAEVYFDGEGKGVIRPVPNPNSDPVTFEYVEGDEATFMTVDRDLDDEQGFNGVIASSQSTDANKIFEAQYWDTNPASPTYFDPDYPDRSIYGAFPFFLTSEFISSDVQAQEAAQGAFNARVGILETVDFTGICNPAHTSGDSIKIVHKGTNVDDINVLNTIKFDLTGGTMSAQTRRRALAHD